MKSTVKRILSFVLCLALLLSFASCKRQQNTVLSTSTAQATLEPQAVATAEPQVTSWEQGEIPEEYKSMLRFEYGGITYYNVTLASVGQENNPVFGDDKFFPADEEGYYIESGLYYVSARGFYRVTKKPCLGNGAIKYKGWRTPNHGTDYAHTFNGVLPVSRMDDPLYVDMCAPYEGESYLSTYHSIFHGDTGVVSQQKYVNVIPIGAIYLDSTCTLPDDTEITLCFGKITCAVKYADEEWQTVYSDFPKPLNLLYPLPWTLEFDQNPVGNSVVPANRVKNMGTHYEITLKVGDFRVHSGEDSRLVGRAFHFWGGFRYFADDGKTGADVLGIACSYQVWIKESQYNGVLLADIGADLRDADGNVTQAFSTKTYDIKSTPRLVIGHNVCPQCYDSVMDSERVQALLGIK